MFIHRLGEIRGRTNENQQHRASGLNLLVTAAMNLLNQAKPTTSLKNRRKKAGWNPDYLEKFLRRTA